MNNLKIKTSWEKWGETSVTAQLKRNKFHKYSPSELPNKATTTSKGGNQNPKPYNVFKMFNNKLRIIRHRNKEWPITKENKITEKYPWVTKI